MIQLALLVALHAQLVAAVTATLPFAATEVVRFDDVGEMPGVQGALNAKVADRSLERISTGLMTLTTAS